MYKMKGAVWLSIGAGVMFRLVFNLAGLLTAAATCAALSRLSQFHKRTHITGDMHESKEYVIAQGNQFSQDGPNQNVTCMLTSLTETCGKPCLLWEVDKWQTLYWFFVLFVGVKSSPPWCKFVYNVFSLPPPPFFKSLVHRAHLQKHIPYWKSAVYCACLCMFVNFWRNCRRLCRISVACPPSRHADGALSFFIWKV